MLIRTPVSRCFCTESEDRAREYCDMGTAVEGSALLDMSKPIDVPLLDNTVQAFYGAGSNEEVSCNRAQPLLFPPATKLFRAP